MEGLGKILLEINRLNSLNETLLIGIDGNCCAGKSTLGRMLENHYDCNLFHMDDFFLRVEQRTPDRLKEVGGNVDYVRFKKEIIENILLGCDFSYKPYNCKIKDYEDPIFTKPKKLNIIEGSYSMHPSLINYYNYKIFIELEFNKQIDRIIDRNGISSVEIFKNKWIPLENSYFDKFDIRNNCDIILSGWMPNDQKPQAITL